MCVLARRPLPSSATQKKPRKTAGLKFIWVEQTKGTDWLQKPGPQCLLQVHVRIATQAVLAVVVESDVAVPRTATCDEPEGLLHPDILPTNLP
jgi:hypothetical protein